MPSSLRLPVAAVSAPVRSVDLLQWGGLRLRAHWTLPALILLTGLALVAAWVPRIHSQGWPESLTWMAVVATAIAFAGSLLLHEAAHLGVARLCGVRVQGVLLTILGGVSDLASEPRHWAADLAIALAGPAASLSLGLSLMTVSALVGPAADGGGILAMPEDARVVATALGWLGQANLGLGLVNLLPIWPLDGGRMLRAWRWRGIGNQARATSEVARVGRLLAVLTTLVGLMLMSGLLSHWVGRPVISGLVCAGAGLALLRLAHGSDRLAQWQLTLQSLPLAGMAVPVSTVAPGTSIRQVMTTRLVRHPTRQIPIVQDGHLVGMVDINRVRAVPPGDWETHVSTIMRPVAALVCLPSSSDAATAVQVMARFGLAEVPVVEPGGQLLGMVRRQDLLAWARVRLAGRSRP